MATAFTNITETCVGRVTGLVTAAWQADVQAVSRRRASNRCRQALAQMESVTQTTAANAEEGAAASEELSAQAACSQELVDDLRALVVDRKSAAPATPAAPAARPAAGQTFVSGRKAA